MVAGTNVSELARKLIEKQDELDLSDREFARKLKVSQPLWTMTRRGKIPVGIRVLRGTVREFPTLGDVVLKDLASEPARPS